MGKNLRLALAGAWTLSVGFVCLVSWQELPDVSIEWDSKDKLVHAGLHFIFSVLWFRWFSLNLSGIRSGILSLIFSTFFGIAIELAQDWFTTTRHADIGDVAANLGGAVFAVSIMWLMQKFRKPVSGNN